MNPTAYDIPNTDYHAESEVKRSRFVACLVPVVSREAAEQQLAAIRLVHRDATHNAYAYIAGAPGNTSDIACSDDGEVSGTAGRPLLQLLMHSGLGEVMIVVSRYYGGTLLGSGGLQRAYSDAGKAVLAQVKRVGKQTCALAHIRVEYSAEAAVRHVLSLNGAVIVDSGYQESVTLAISYPKTIRAALFDQLQDVCRGQLQWQELDS